MIQEEEQSALARIQTPLSDLRVPFEKYELSFQLQKL
jgi:hypothetical protein